MRKLITLLALLLAFSFSLVAQEAEQDNITEDPEVTVPVEEQQPETDEDFVYKMNQPGDWFVKVGVNGAFPNSTCNNEFRTRFELGILLLFSTIFCSRWRCKF